MAKIRCSVCKLEKELGIKVDTSLSPETWADRLEVHRTTITRHLGHAPLSSIVKKEKEQVDPRSLYKFDQEDGTAHLQMRASTVAQTMEEVYQAFRDEGLDPDDFDLIVKRSTWENGAVEEDGSLRLLHSCGVTAKEKPVAEKASLETAASLIEGIRSFTYIPEPKAFSDHSFVIMPTDLQTGKVDFNGGTKETVAQALESFAKGAEFVKEFRPREVCIVDAGDSIENIYNTSSQMGTNDLDLPHQVEVASNIFLEGIKMFAPLTPSLRYAAVSSNHGAHRIGPKSPGGDAHADYGIVIARMLGTALKLNPVFDHVTVQTPEPHMESLYFQTSGTDIGVVHGHQAGGPDKLGEWWKGQSHGGLPTGQARILLAGHWHSFRVQQSGDARWIFVGPASDRGSSWFTNLKGESAESGMLSFTTAENRWDNLRVL